MHFREGFQSHIPQHPAPQLTQVTGTCWGLTLTVPFSLKPSPELLSLAGAASGKTGLLVGKRDMRGHSDLAGMSQRMQKLQSHTTLQEEGRWLLARLLDGEG